MSLSTINDPSLQNPKGSCLSKNCLGFKFVSYDSLFRGTSFRFNNIVVCVRQFERLFPRIVFPDSRLFLRITVPGFVYVSNNCISRFACFQELFQEKGFTSVSKN